MEFVGKKLILFQLKFLVIFCRFLGGFPYTAYRKLTRKYLLIPDASRKPKIFKHNRFWALFSFVFMMGYLAISILYLFFKKDAKFNKLKGTEKIVAAIIMHGDWICNKLLVIYFVNNHKRMKKILSKIVRNIKLILAEKLVFDFQYLPFLLFTLDVIHFILYNFYFLRVFFKIFNDETKSSVLVFLICRLALLGPSIWIRYTISFSFNFSLQVIHTFTNSIANKCKKLSSNDYYKNEKDLFNEICEQIRVQKHNLNVIDKYFLFPISVIILQTIFHVINYAFSSTDRDSSIFPDPILLSGIISSSLYLIILCNAPDQITRQVSFYY